MKNRAVFTTLMLLSLLVFLTPLAHAQPARDMQRDLVVSHGGSRGSGEFGAVNGKIKNISANHYACVRLDFNLATRYDMRQLGEPVRQLGVLSLEVRDIRPNSEREFSKPLPFPAGLAFNPPRECTGQITEPPVPVFTVNPNVNELKVVLYDNPNFGGRQTSLGIGTHKLIDFNFNDMPSSIKVPAGLVVIVYEHFARGVGYGLWVDFLEDQPNLAQFQLDNKISYLKIVPRLNSNSIWVRNGLKNGRFDAGHYLVVPKGSTRPAHNPNPLIGPPIPEPPDRSPAFCTIAGTVSSRPEYQTYIPKTTITLHSNGSPTSFSVLVTNGEYKLTNVPAGTYEVIGNGPYPVTNTSRGPITLAAYPHTNQKVTCERDGSYTINFEIRSTEG